MAKEHPPSPGQCKTLDDIPAWLRRGFEKGNAPCDAPPGLEELYYQKWVKLGGVVTPKKPVTMDDL